MQLKHFEEEESKRIKISDTYKKGLEGVTGISYLTDRPGLKKSHSFFPILVDPEEYGQTRDFIYRLLVKNNIFPRRYFYPLISDLSLYRSIPSASKQNLPVSSRISQQILCLPVYADLDQNTIIRIIEIIKSGAI